MGVWLMKDSGSGGGLGLAGVLTVIFFVLKVIGVIDWSWIWVFSPLWISVLLFTSVLGTLLFIAYYLDKRDDDEL